MKIIQNFDMLAQKNGAMQQTHYKSNYKLAINCNYYMTMQNIHSSSNEQSTKIMLAVL